MNDIDDVDDDGDGADDSLWNSVEWIVRTMMDKNCDMDSSVDLYWPYSVDWLNLAAVRDSD